MVAPAMTHGDYDDNAYIECNSGGYDDEMAMKMVRIIDGEQVHYRNRGDATVFRGGHHAIME